MTVDPPKSGLVEGGDLREQAAEGDERGPADTTGPAVDEARAANRAHRRVALNDWPQPFRALPPRGLSQR